MITPRLLGSVLPALWIAWVLYWWVLARDVKATRRAEPVASRLAHILPIVLAIWLIAAPRFPASLLAERFVPRTPLWLGIGTLMVAAGLGFTVWARRYLGRNWSGVVTIKEDHELVRSGPYRFVRHPIYGGLLLALAGSALARGEWRAIFGFVIAFAALWRKLGLEERWLAETFGEGYARYRAEVAALIPFVL
jgi:protein-S-isoprenylcysteine O-methyltransferase Ste14